MSFFFCETKDRNLIYETLTGDPKAYHLMGDDFAPTIPNYRPTLDQRVHYITAMRNETRTYMGIWVFVEESPICWDLHCCLTRVGRSWATRMLKELIEWTFSNPGDSDTQCLRITGKVPSFNFPVIRMATEAGMERMGIDRKSFMKNGRLRDRVLFGISKQ